MSSNASPLTLERGEIVRLEGKAWRSFFDDVIELERQSMGGLGPFERDWLITKKSPEQVKHELKMAKKFPGIKNANSPFASPTGQPASNPSSFTSVNTTNVETNLWTPGIWTPIPANDMQAGKYYEHKSGGVLGTSSAAPTATWTPRVGQSGTPGSNITMGASTGTTMIASLAAVPWFSFFGFTIRALGLAASGATATGNGFIVIGGLTTAAGIVQALGSTVATTVDNTAATGYILSNTWGTNAAANTVTCQFVTPVHSIN